MERLSLLQVQQSAWKPGWKSRPIRRRLRSCMEEALKGLQVTAVETVGTQFDPRIHEALGSIETAEFPDHQVIEEIRRGYKIRERLLRPAMVKIAVNSAQVND